MKQLLKSSDGHRGLIAQIRLGKSVLALEKCTRILVGGVDI